MAEYTGPVKVDVSSYTAFRNATLGNWYDVDGVYGAQCVDYFKLLNYNIGYSSPYAKTDGVTGYSTTMWTDTTARAWNQTGGTSTDYYELITSLEDVKQGDMMIMTTAYASGHNAIATTDYSEHTEVDGKIYMVLLGQNQVVPDAKKGEKVTEATVNVSGFLGAFRLKAWQGSSPSPTPVTVIRNETSFPWVLYSNKLRGRRLK